MTNLYQHLTDTCTTPSLVHTFAYGYLDQMLESYCEGLVTEQHVRKHHYMLRIAVETRLQDLDRADRARRTSEALFGRVRPHSAPPQTFPTVQEEIEQTDPEAVAETAVTEP